MIYSGWTLLEVLFVTIIIIIIIGLGIFSRRSAVERARQTEHRSWLRLVARGIETQRVGDGRFMDGSSDIIDILERETGSIAFSDSENSGAGSPMTLYYWVSSDGNDYAVCIIPDQYNYYVCDGTKVSLAGNGTAEEGRQTDSPSPLNNKASAAYLRHWNGTSWI